MSYAGDLIAHYRDDMPLWVFLEVIGFGLFVNFYLCCAGRREDDAMLQEHYALKSVKAPRNAAAHNSCVLHNLRGRLGKPVGRIASSLKGELGVDPTLVDSTRRVPVVHDLGALLLTYDAVVPSGSGSAAAHSGRMHHLSEQFGENLAWYAKQPEVHDCLSVMSELFAAVA